MPELISISPSTRTTLLELAAHTGKQPTELLTAAVEEYRRRIAGSSVPIADIPGVNPADVWEADAQADAGQVTPHSSVFARLRNRR